MSRAPLNLNQGHGNFLNRVAGGRTWCVPDGVASGNCLWHFCADRGFAANLRPSDRYLFASGCESWVHFPGAFVEPKISAFRNPPDNVSRFFSPLRLAKCASGLLVPLAALSALQAHGRDADSYLFTTFAGAVGSSGSAEGTGIAAKFSSPSGLTVVAAGNLSGTTRSSSNPLEVKPTIKKFRTNPRLPAIPVVGRAKWVATVSAGRAGVLLAPRQLTRWLVKSIFPPAREERTSR